MNYAIPFCDAGFFFPTRDAFVPALEDRDDDVQEEEESLDPWSGRDDDILNSVLDALGRASTKSGISVTADLLTRTVDLLQALPLEFPLPRIVVESEGEIGLDWDEGPRRVVSVIVDESPFIGFSALFGNEPLYGRMPIATAMAEDFPDIPDTLYYLLSRLYPTG